MREQLGLPNLPSSHLGPAERGGIRSLTSAASVHARGLNPEHFKGLAAVHHEAPQRQGRELSPHHQSTSGWSEKARFS